MVPTPSAVGYLNCTFLLSLFHFETEESIIQSQLNLVEFSRNHVIFYSALTIHCAEQICNNEIIQRRGLQVYRNCGHTYTSRLWYWQWRKLGLVNLQLQYKRKSKTWMSRLLSPITYSENAIVLLKYSDSCARACVSLPRTFNSACIPPCHEYPTRSIHF